MAVAGVRKFRRDPKLVTRMYFTMFMLGVLYAIFVMVLWAFGIPVIFIGSIVGIMMLVQFFLSDKLIIWASGAKVVTREQEPALHAMVERLAKRAGMPMPRVAIMQNSVPNAFATGRSPKNALVAVTTGIRERLTERELEAVLGHEMSHVRNRDMLVLAIASFFVTLASFLMQMFFWSMLFGGMGGNRRESGGAGAIMIVYLITMVVYFVGQLLVLALTRYREFDADHGGAELSGDPGSLASALEKITGALGRIPEKDLRQVQTARAFLFAPLHLKGEDVIRLFSTHPPVEERVRRLREFERQMRFGL
ncbi:MAG: zinc metalloprotease HtpX [Chloroflexi bacterium]|nr:zinc metalloprotease HtpX [Chloroflexota bacterium]